ncbi:MAG: hypothetical protein V1897_07340 [Pseudomonadota bacterium]
MKFLKQNRYIELTLFVAVTAIVVWCSAPAWSDSNFQEKTVSTTSEAPGLSNNDDSPMVPNYGRGGGGGGRMSRPSAPRVAPRPVSRPSYSAPRVSRPVSQPRYTAPRVSRPATTPSRTSVRTQPTRPTTPTSLRTQPVRPTTSSTVRTQPVRPTTPISSVGRHPITPTTPTGSGLVRRPPSSVTSTSGQKPGTKPPTWVSSTGGGKPVSTGSSGVIKPGKILVDPVGSIGGRGPGGRGPGGVWVGPGGPWGPRGPWVRGPWGPWGRRGPWGPWGRPWIPIVFPVVEPTEPVEILTEPEPVTVVTSTQVETPSPLTDPCARIKRDYASWDPGDLNQKGMEELDKNNIRIALCLFELALKRLEAGGRTEEPLTVNVLENLAKTYEALGKREDAASVSYRASVLRERLKM